MTSKSLLLPLLSGALLAGVAKSSAAAAFDAFLKFGSPSGGAVSFHGDSPDPQFNGTNGWSEVVGFDQGAVNLTTIGGTGSSGAGRTRLSEFTLVKLVDRGSPALFRACATGGHYAAAQLALRERASGPVGEQPLSLAKLDLAFITGIHWSCDGGGVPTERVTVAYGALQWTLRSTTAGASDPTTVNWDQILNTGGFGPLPGITLVPATLAGGTVGTPYTQTFTAAGGVAPYHYTIYGGALPSGLSLSAGGVLSGIPTAPGSFTFRVAGNDDNACFDENRYNITITNNCTARFSSITQSSTNVVLRLEGAAGCRYQIQAANDVTGPWQSFGAILTLPANGIFDFTDNRTIAWRFYRAVFLP